MFEQRLTQQAKDLLGRIASRGLKRDFFDVYKYCRITGKSLLDVVELDRKKFSRQDSEIPHLIKSLTFFEDAERTPERATEVDAEWTGVKEFFIRETKGLLNHAL